MDPKDPNQTVPGLMDEDGVGRHDVAVQVDLDDEVVVQLVGLVDDDGVQLVPLDLGDEVVQLVLVDLGDEVVL